MFFAMSKHLLIISIAFVCLQINTMDSNKVLTALLLKDVDERDSYKDPIVIVQEAIKLQNNINELRKTDSFSNVMIFASEIETNYKNIVQEARKTIFECIQNTYSKYSSEMQLRTYAQAFGHVGKRYIALGDSFHKNVLNNRFKEAKNLLSKGVDINLPYRGKTKTVEGNFLAYLCLTRYNDAADTVRSNTVKQIEFLLKNNVNPNIVIDGAMYLLHMLIISNYSSLIKLFLQYKANINVEVLKDRLPFKKGKTALEMIQAGYVPEITEQDIQKYINKKS